MSLRQRTSHSFRAVIAPTGESLSLPLLERCRGAVSLIGRSHSDHRLGLVLDPMKNGMEMPMGINGGLHTRVPNRTSETQLPAVQARTEGGVRSGRSRRHGPGEVQAADPCHGPVGQWTSNGKTEEPMVRGSKGQCQPHGGINSCCCCACSSSHRPLDLSHVIPLILSAQENPICSERRRIPVRTRGGWLGQSSQTHGA